MRRIAIISAVVLTATCAALALLPWWLGLAISAIGRPFGLSYVRYVRQGYSRFQIEDVRVQRRAVLVRIDSAGAETPLLWLWHRWTGRPSEIVAGNWTAEAQPRADDAAAPEKTHGWVPLHAQLVKTGNRLDRWVPRARIGAGTVTWPRGELRIAPASWEQRTLTTANVSYRALHAAAKLSLPATEPMRLELTSGEPDWALSLSSGGAAIEGALTWLGQRAELTAHFPAEGWKADEAIARASNWEIPAERIDIGAQYRAVKGSGVVQWRADRLSANLTAESEPRTGASAPPLTVTLRGEGDSQRFRIAAVQVALPGIRAALDEPVVIDRRGQLQSPPARFTFESELEKLPWLKATGQAKGEGRIGTDASGRVVVEFSLAADDLKLAGVQANRFAASGHLDWPSLTVTAGLFDAGERGKIAFEGGWDFRTHEIHEAVVKGSIGSVPIARWLPAGLQFDRATVEGRVNGPWRTAEHSGRLAATNLHFNKTKPANLEGEWRGHGAAIEAFSAKAAAGQAELSVSGQGSREKLTLQALSFAFADEPPLRLVGPADLRWQPALRLGTLRLAGGNADLALQFEGAETSRLKVDAHHFRSEWLRPFLDLPPTEWAVDALALQGSWRDGAAEFSGETALTIHLGPNRAAQVSARFTGDGKGLVIEALKVAEGTGPIVEATAHLPVVVRPGQRPSFEASETDRFALKATTSPNPEFWRKIAELSGIEIVDPAAQVDLSGTLDEPQGRAQVQVAKIAISPERFKWPWPKIESLALELKGDRTGVRLERLAVAIDGQTLRATGRLPAASERWREMWRNPRELVDRVQLHVEVPEADLAAVAQHIPAYMAPKGRLQVDVTFDPDRGFGGFVRVRDAASRPLGPLGVLQDVNAELRLNRRTLELREVAARMGGQRVLLQGNAELPPNGEPRMELSLKGENLPFVRRTGLLVRGDLDLKLEMRRTNRAKISGTVRLRDSLFLSDLRALIPSGTKSSGRAMRPPYFSIDAPPVNTWQIDVGVQGDKFMRLRTPVFNGTASARFHVTGALGDPRASGEATIDRGTVRLPFASFDVQQGELRLAPDQAEPQLLVTGTTRRYGYDLRLELTGPISAPNLTFTSSPPLAAEQVLLMVMAGQAPHDEITTTDRQRIARFGAFFGQSLLGSFGGDSSGADRLTISSGENISEQGRETYSIEYKLNDRWALTGEYDEFDEYYGGLKWRIYTRGGKPDEK